MVVTIADPDVRFPNAHWQHTRMNLTVLPFRSPLAAYEQQAESLLAAHRAADPAAIDLFHRKHPRFLDEKIKWRPKFIPDTEIRDAALSLDDARLTVARYYDVLDWPSLVAHVQTVSGTAPSSNSNPLSKPWSMAISPCSK